ncbi:unnamed protein product [Amoebophrya sp. A25]|nr:unnamed protein product [Amoebophrya sp. A25]|eukprot:GSA25T00017208001.1
MSTHKYEVEYAKSGRAACKACKGKIDKDAIRIGYSQDVPAGDDGVKNYAMMGVKWYHIHCFPKMKGPKWMKENLCVLDDIKGLEAVKPEDRKKMQELWEALVSADTSTAMKSPMGKAGGVKRPAETSLADLMENQGVLSDAEYAAIKEVKGEIAKKSVAQLAEMLSRNGLPKNGPKMELIERVAENRVLGVLPRCQLCPEEKGRLLWNRADGKISCQGYFDDVVQRRVRCKGPGADAKIERKKWLMQDPAQ